LVVSTDPLAHKFYALWGLENDLHILLDKPVTSAIDAVNSMSAAASIETDYEEIATARKRQDRKRAFVLCAHRRYHPGFDTATQLIRETSLATSCPVTNIHVYHSDGQWRLPDEIKHQDHHSYHHGHGKLSHSGFHFLDTIYRFRKAAQIKGKTADHVGVTASCIQPNGFLSQLTREDYVRYFGSDYNTLGVDPDPILKKKFAAFGEMDVEMNLEFMREEEVIGLASASLIHGGFSRRSWMIPGKDLYKGNGRVKHEAHRIHVGPFLGIQIHSCQAKDRHDQCDEGDELIGGNNHFEIWVFRNTGMIEGEPFEKISFKELCKTGNFRTDRLFIHQVKNGAIEEFLRACRSPHPEKGRRSDLSDHQMPVRLMSAAYQSLVSRKETGNPLVIVPWNETDE
ncbi:MAG TPA: hypothetical protein PKX94_07520, partial [Opitutales bacterium]|nr:hypothetical protein [Opitutales bacterium]